LFGTGPGAGAGVIF